MKLAWILWLASVLPQPAADPLCLATTIYLEARDQSELGQRAVAEVALRRLDSGRWGDEMCEVVTAPKQFAPTLTSPHYRLKNLDAWNEVLAITWESLRQWSAPKEGRKQVVPGADHFFAHRLVAKPAWATGEPVALIGGHAFYRVQKL
jgi:spore germination cell wall hydrolase CwlJ-like protein